MKAIRLDSKNQTITEVEVKKGIEAIREQLGENVDVFAVVQMNRLDFYIDDEGLLKESYIDEDGNAHNMTGFQVHGYNQVIMGNSLILGLNPATGESTDAPVSVEEVEKMVTFVRYDNPEDRPQPHMTIISW